MRVMHCAAFGHFGASKAGPPELSSLTLRRIKGSGPEAEAGLERGDGAVTMQQRNAGGSGNLKETAPPAICSMHNNGSASEQLESRMVWPPPLHCQRQAGGAWTSVYYSAFVVFRLDIYMLQFQGFLEFELFELCRYLPAFLPFGVRMCSCTLSALTWGKREAHSTQVETDPFKHLGLRISVSDFVGPAVLEEFW